MIKKVLVYRAFKQKGEFWNDEWERKSKLKFGLYNDDEKTKIAKGENIESGDSKTVKIIVSVKENASSFKDVIKIYDKASLTLDFEI